jgi:hypothetical protein|tara:strand:- start:260 stop:451 length:192 start_codon:yes stop_codon:yes gene_type:complete
MAKTIQEMVEEAVKNMVEDGKLVIQNDSGDTIEDLTVAIDGPEDDDYEDDSESDEDEDEDSDK